MKLSAAAFGEEGVSGAAVTDDRKSGGRFRIRR
jgi:hypothetical protein